MEEERVEHTDMFKYLGGCSAKQNKENYKSGEKRTKLLKMPNSTF